MPQRQPRDLVVLSRERSGLYDVVQRLGEFSGVEIRVDSRRKERRKGLPAGQLEERRRRERRALIVTDKLQTDGWVFIAGVDRT